MDHLRIAPNLIMFLYFLVCEIFRFIDLAHQQAGKYDSTYGIVFSYPFTDYHMERSSAYDDPATAHRNRDRPHRLHHTGGKKLYLSKPNASGMLRMLEQELVYEIFSRTNSGIFRTEAGLRFLEHTKIILVQMQELYAVRGQGRIYRLRLGVQSYSPTVEAAIRLPQVSRERYQLECVPIPDEFMQLYCIPRRRGTRAPEIARYLQLLQAELEDEDSDQTEGGR